MSELIVYTWRLQDDACKYIMIIIVTWNLCLNHLHAEFMDSLIILKDDKFTCNLCIDLLIWMMQHLNEIPV